MDSRNSCRLPGPGYVSWFSKLRGWTVLPWNLVEFHSETHSTELHKLQQQAKPCFNKALDVIFRMAREYV